VFDKHALRKKNVFPSIKNEHAKHGLMEKGLSLAMWAGLSSPKTQAFLDEEHEDRT